MPERYFTDPRADGLFKKALRKVGPKPERPKRVWVSVARGTLTKAGRRWKDDVRHWERDLTAAFNKIISADVRAHLNKAVKARARRSRPTGG